MWELEKLLKLSLQVEANSTTLQVIQWVYEVYG